MRATSTSPSRACSRTGHPACSARAMTIDVCESSSEGSVSHRDRNPARDRTSRARLLSGSRRAASAAPAVDVPPEGSCPPRPDPVDERHRARARGRGAARLQARRARRRSSQCERLRGWLPEEVWERRDQFFFEGMQLEIGPVLPALSGAEVLRRRDARERGHGHGRRRREPRSATRGTGLPFAPERDRRRRARRRRCAGRGTTATATGPPASAVPSGSRRSRKGGRERRASSGKFFFMPCTVYPAARAAIATSASRRAARFDKPEVARGLSWRQYQPTAAEKDYKVTDEVFVYLPDLRKVRRAPPQSARGRVRAELHARELGGNIGMTLPSQTQRRRQPGDRRDRADAQRGFVGLVIRPNAYTWKLAGARDVLAPANVRASRLPARPRAQLRPERAVARLRPLGASAARSCSTACARTKRAASTRVQLWIDALTQQPLYWISRRGERRGLRGRHLREPLQRRRPGRRGVGRQGPGLRRDAARRSELHGRGRGRRLAARVVPARQRAAVGEEAKDILSVQGLQREGH